MYSFPIKVYKPNLVFGQTIRFLKTLYILYMDENLLVKKVQYTAMERNCESSSPVLTVEGTHPLEGRMKLAMKIQKSFCMLCGLCVYACRKSRWRRGEVERAAEVQQKMRPFWQHRGVGGWNKSGRQGERAEEQSRSEKGHENQWAGKPNQVLLVKAEVNVG